MTQAAEITGMRFDALMALCREPPTGGNAIWHCICDCGLSRNATVTYLRSGRAARCAECSKIKRFAERPPRLTHGHTRHRVRSRVYHIWTGMIDRTENPNIINYSNYGGRGIKICARWRNSFEAFLLDMGEPLAHQSIDRINPNSDYEPGNCRWATRLEQAYNKRTTKILTCAGRSMPLGKWAKELGIKRTTLSSRIAKGWSDEQVLTTPIKGSVALIQEPTP